MLFEKGWSLFKMIINLPKSKINLHETAANVAHSPGRYSYTYIDNMGMYRCSAEGMVFRNRVYKSQKFLSRTGHKIL